ncbi:MAG: Cadherin [Planctomycetota bacterium]|nr:Cadherin [Planctomycetota bacterium]
MAEGTLATFSATSTDIDAGAVLTFSLDPGAPAGATLEPSTGLFRFTPPSGSKTYTFTIRATDNGSPAMSDSATFTITATSVAPTVTVGPDIATGVGLAFNRAGSFADPGKNTWTATVDYGDGSGPWPLAALGADRSFALSHAYDRPGTYPVTVRVDDGNTSGTATFAVVVKPPVRVQAVRLTQKGKKFTTVFITYSDGVDPTGAGLASTYRIDNDGKDGKYGTKDDKVVLLRPASYDSTTKTAKLIPRKPLPTGPVPQLRITASAITDPSRLALDGDHDNKPGGDFTTLLRKGGVTVAGFRSRNHQRGPALSRFVVRVLHFTSRNRHPSIG